jgi:hypothetical protein
MKFESRNYMTNLTIFSILDCLAFFETVYNLKKATKMYSDMATLYETAN